MKTKVQDHREFCLSLPIDHLRNVVENDATFAAQVSVWARSPQNGWSIEDVEHAKRIARASRNVLRQRELDLETKRQQQALADLERAIVRAFNIADGREVGSLQEIAEILRPHVHHAGGN